MQNLAGIPRLEELELENRRVLVRADLDLPVDESTGSVTDDAKLRALLPTLEHMVAHGARLVVAGHRGRPRGSNAVPLSLEPVGSRIAELTEWEVFLPEASAGDVARKLVAELRTGQVCLLENLLGSPGEAAGDEAFVRELGRLADVYVADALSVLCLGYASVVGLPMAFRQRAAGLALSRELEAFDQLDSARALAIIGGSFAREAALLESLLDRCRTVAVGGQIGWTLLSCQGLELGQTKVDRTAFPQARTLLDQARQKKVELLLPADVMIELGDAPGTAAAVRTHAVGQQQRVLDIGPGTAAEWRARAAQATAVLWNGPLTSKPGAAQPDGSLALTRALIDGPTFCLVGPDSAALVDDFGLDRGRFGLVTAGGEAARQLLLGKRLRGLDALRGRT